ncbi:hypothetical protein [Biformimicrobium ophioploci]|nr:hypothetical protein [Microbulbifer sp. NKW57]
MKIFVVLLAIFSVGCSATYRVPESGADTAEITFKEGTKIPFGSSVANFYLPRNLKCGENFMIAEKFRGSSTQEIQSGEPFIIHSFSIGPTWSPLFPPKNCSGVIRFVPEKDKKYELTLNFEEPKCNMELLEVLGQEAREPVDFEELPNCEDGNA